jgi:hypothetical protein
MPLSNIGSSSKKWFERVIPYARKYCKKSLVTVEYEIWTPWFERVLDNWNVLCVSIWVADQFKSLWRNSNKIEWDLSKERKKTGHSICIFKKDWKYYFLNSRYWDDRDIKEVDMKTVWLFKSKIAYNLI